MIAAGSTRSTRSEAGPSLADRHARFVRRRVFLVAALAGVLSLSFLFDVATGPSTFPLGDVVRGLFDPARLPAAQAVILWDVRLPYATMALLVGGALGLAGAEMQTALDNPLASPFTLGISAAATLGAATAIAFDIDLFDLPQTYVIPLSAFVSATAAMIAIQVLARAYGASVNAVVLFGIAIHFSLTALEWLVHFLVDANASQQIVFWTMGSLARATWDKIAVVAAVGLVCLPTAMHHAWAMNAMRGGDDHARSVGIDAQRLRMIMLLRASLLAATAVAFVGAIGFIGLLGPHIARLSLGEDHRFFLPGSALAGALLLSLASIASKAIVPGVLLPVGILTALIGVPLFMALVIGRRPR